MSDSRIDVIGQNGNDGDHYEETEQEKARKSFDSINASLLQKDPYPVTWPYNMGSSYIDKVRNNPDGFFTQEGWTPTVDKVNNPPHYNLFGGYQVLDVIKKVVGDYEDLTTYQAYVYGNIIKYILRAPNKNHIEDLKKAQLYLGWLIDGLEGK